MFAKTEIVCYTICEEIDMSIAKTIFKGIDVIFDFPQNKSRKNAYKGVDFVVEKDVPYFDNDDCRLDTYYLKKPEGKYPVMFYIHGGGFVAGDKHHRRAVSEWYAMQGFFVVNVNYGICPAQKFPAPLQHLVYALNWVGENADKYNLDLDKIVVAGDSAGAYYSTALISVAESKELQDKIGVTTDLHFAGAYLNCGIYDIISALNAKLPLNMGAVILKDFASIDKKDIDTYKYLDLCVTVNLVNEKFPQTFVTYAEKDVFCKGQSEKFISVLKEKGIEVEEYHSTKFTSNHCFSLNWKGKDAVTNNALVEKFLEKIVKGE